MSKITIRGIPGFKYDEINGLDQILGIKEVNPRSYSLLCTLNHLNALKWKNTLFEFGHRSDNDVILHLQREFIDIKQLMKKSIPKHTFSFEDERININYVSVMADVSVDQLQGLHLCDFNRIF